MPAYLSVMTLSPGLTVMVTVLPSTTPPGPTEITSATEGFSLAEPVRMMPPLVVSSASVIFSTTRSASGVSFMVGSSLYLYIINEFSVSTRLPGVLTLIIIPHYLDFARGILEKFQKFTNWSNMDRGPSGHSRPRAARISPASSRAPTAERRQMAARPGLGMRSGVTYSAASSSIPAARIYGPPGSSRPSR